MYEDITQELLLSRMLGRIPDKFDKRPSAVIYDTASATAIELQNLYIELEYLIRNSYADTAAREFLILICKDRGIIPKPATNAILLGEFAPVTVDVSGQRFNISNLNYTVVGQIGPGQYQVVCETPGAAGNQFLGDMTPMDYIDGLQTASLVQVLVPGEDEEDTEELRKRYLESFDEHAFGGNRADYLAKVRGVDGVGDAKIMRAWNGDIKPADMVPPDEVTAWYNAVIGTLDPSVAPWLSAVYTAANSKKLTVGGTVLVVVIDALYGPASDTLVDIIQTALDPEQNAGEGYGLAPIGHVVKVASANAVTVDVATTLTFDADHNWANLQGPVTDAVDGYLLDLRKEWGGSERLVVRISQIETRVLAVDGVIDIIGTMINGESSNLTLSYLEIPVIGGVSP